MQQLAGGRRDGSIPFCYIHLHVNNVYVIEKNPTGIRTLLFDVSFEPMYITPAQRTSTDGIIHTAIKSSTRFLTDKNMQVIRLFLFRDEDQADFFVSRLHH